MNLRMLFVICLAATLFAGIALAQQSAPAKDIVIEKEFVGEPPAGAVGVMGAGMPGPGDFVFLSSEFGGEDRTVKGAPYSAECVTERTQVLEDGNRIVQKNTAQVYRDGEGRTRRELQFGPIGPFAPSAQPHHSIFIHDSVKGERFMLDPEEQVARKMPQFFNKHVEPLEGAEVQEDVVAAPGPHVGMRQVFKYFSKPAEGKTESLGKQMIEGVEAEGTRTTTTIPEGQIGNERAIEIVTEKWYSPELQINVMTRHSDPRFGTTVYQLRNIDRTEPDKSLFQVPAGYKVEEMPAGNHVFIKNKVQH